MTHVAIGGAAFVGGAFAEALRRDLGEMVTLTKFDPRFTFRTYSPDYLTRASLKEDESRVLARFGAGSDPEYSSAALELQLNYPGFPGEFSLFRNSQVVLRNEPLDTTRLFLDPGRGYSALDTFKFEIRSAELNDGIGAKECRLPLDRDPAELLKVVMEGLHMDHDRQIQEFEEFSHENRWSNEKLEYPSQVRFRRQGEPVLYEINGLEGLAGMSPEMFDAYYRNYADIKDPENFKKTFDAVSTRINGAG